MLKHVYLAFDLYMHTVATVESPILKSADAVNHSSSGELGLMQASKFGFMIETCILAARNDECLVCPAHKEHPLTIRDIAPDLVRNLNFSDIVHCGNIFSSRGL